jgi:hypothetical protein
VGDAATVIVAVPDLVASAAEVAVTVTDSELAVAAGAVKVADVVVVFNMVPPPLTLQVTPAAFLSLDTVAVNVTVSVPSTVLAEAATVTPTAGALPPQPMKGAVRTEVNMPRTTNHQKLR